MATRQSTKVPRTCETCEKSFLVFLSELKRRGRRFCSHACAQAEIIPIEVRLRRHLAPPNERGCQLWQGAADRKGYGRIGKTSPAPNRQTMLAHRLAWELANGPIPDGLCVLHECDMPACCNPEHLFLGTKADNNADMCAKKRQHRGETSGIAKLSEAQVLEIRQLYKHRQVTGNMLAARFSVTQATISDIVTRRSWKHI